MNCQEKPITETLKTSSKKTIYKEKDEIKLDSLIYENSKNDDLFPISVENTSIKAIKKEKNDDLIVSLLNDNKIDECTKICNNLSLKELSSNSTQISSFKSNEEDLKLLKKILFIYLKSFFNKLYIKGKPNTNEELLSLINDIINYHWRFKIAEIIYVFEQGIKNKWGKIYERIDINIINEWFFKYDTLEGRSDMFEANNKYAERDIVSESELFNYYNEAAKSKLDKENEDKIYHKIGKINVMFENIKYLLRNEGK